MLVGDVVVFDLRVVRLELEVLNDGTLLLVVHEWDQIVLVKHVPTLEDLDLFTLWIWLELVYLLLQLKHLRVHILLLILAILLLGVSPPPLHHVLIEHLLWKFLFKIILLNGHKNLLLLWELLEINGKIEYWLIPVLYTQQLVLDKVVIWHVPIVKGLNVLENDSHFWHVLGGYPQVFLRFRQTLHLYFLILIHCVLFLLPPLELLI